MKALVGAWDNRPHSLIAEITALRTRVAELERALARCEQENAALRESMRDATEAGRPVDDIAVTADSSAQVVLSTT